MPVANELAEKWEAWKRLGVLASEMEASTLFTVGAALGVATGAVFCTVWNQERFLLGLDKQEDEVHDTARAIETVVEAIRILVGESKQD
jgi:uridine phosphorylase